MLQRWEALAAPSWAALGSVPSSFRLWQHWKRDKGVTKGVSPLGDKETSPVTLIPRDKRYQTSRLGAGFAFGIKPSPAAALPTEVPISHCLQQQLSIIILLLHYPAPPDPLWGHKLPWQGPLAPDGARGGQRLSGGAQPAQTPGGGGWTGVVFSSSGDTRPQDEGCRRPLLVHGGKIPTQGHPTQAAWLPIALYCCWPEPLARLLGSWGGGGLAGDPRSHPAAGVLDPSCRGGKSPGAWERWPWDEAGLCSSEAAVPGGKGQGLAPLQPTGQALAVGSSASPGWGRQQGHLPGRRHPETGSWPPP